MRYCLLILPLLIYSCSPSRFVVPLGRKEKAVSLTAGGPLILEENQNIPYPIPLSSFTYGYGLNKKITTHASLHLTPLAFGILHIEAGYLYEWYYNNKSKIGITTDLTGHLSTVFSDWTTNFHPQFDANLYWHFLGDSHFHCDCPKDRNLNAFLYLGASSWLTFNQSNIEGLKEGYRILLNPHFGLNAGSKRSKWNLELKYFAPYIRTSLTGIPYYNPMNQYGAFGLNLGFYRLF